MPSFIIMAYVKLILEGVGQYESPLPSETWVSKVQVEAWLVSIILKMWKFTNT